MTTKEQVMELAKQAGLAMVPNTIPAVFGAITYLEIYTTLVRNAAMEEAAQALRDIDALHNAGLVDVTVDIIRKLKETL